MSLAVQRRDHASNIAKRRLGETVSLKGWSYTENQQQPEEIRAEEPQGEGAIPAHTGMLLDEPRSELAGGVSAGNHQVGQKESANHRPLGGIVLFLLRSLLLFCILFVAATGGVLSWFDHRFEGQISPNITIRGVPVGEMRAEEARGTLHNAYAPYLKQPLTLTYNERTWTPTLQELGVHVNIDEAIQQAMGAGRHHGYVENLREIVAVWQNGLEVPLGLTVNQETLQQYVLHISTEVNHPATDAQVAFDGETTRTVSAVSGRQVQVNEMVHDITSALQTLEPQQLPLRTIPLLPLLNDKEAVRARQAIGAILRAPLTLKATSEGEEREWVWSVPELGQLVQVYRTATKEPGEDQFIVTLDEHEIYRRVSEIAEETVSGVVYPRVDWNGGDLKIIREGEPGRRVDEDLATTLTLATLYSSDRRVVQLPFRKANPPVTADNLHMLGITELLGVGRSDFTGSEAYRITNIKAGMRQLHGILVAPGEEFSFNENISISPQTGYVAGYAIVRNRTQLEWGGGICQDSTTMFRAAFWSGLPILERWGHSFYISWYDKYGYGEYGNGPGMDATIFTGGRNFRFLNDTGNWILIQTSVDVSRVLAEVRIYGTDPGRTVKLEGPRIFNRTPPPAAPVYIPDGSLPPGAVRRTDTARGGMSIVFTRIIEEDGVEVRRDEFLTRFKPWPNIYLINPASLGPDGRLLPTPTPTPEGGLPPDGQPQPEPGGEPAPQPQPEPGGEPAPQPQPQPQPEPAPTQEIEPLVPGHD